MEEVMMKKRVSMLVLAAILVVSVFLLCACGGSADSLKGTWIGQNNDDVGATWIFDGKGKCKMENDYGAKEDGVYTIEGNNVSIELNGWDEGKVYQFTINGSSLSLDATDEISPSYELEKK